MVWVRLPDGAAWAWRKLTKADESSLIGKGVRIMSDDLTEDAVDLAQGLASAIETNARLLHYRVVPDSPPGTIRLPDQCACGGSWPCPRAVSLP